MQTAPATPDGWPTFGAAVKFLRRRARLTQRELGWAVGYSEAHVCRLEQGRRLPDPATVAALFIPALGLEGDPGLSRRLVELAQQARWPAVQEQGLADGPNTVTGVEPVPPAPRIAVPRPAAMAQLRDLLEGHGAAAVCGLAGAGKTSLIAQLARDAASNGGDVGWVTLIKDVNTSADALVRRMALILHARGDAEVAGLLDRERSGSGLELDRRLGLLAAA